MNETTLAPVSAPLLARQKGIAHGFFTRQGGVSKGIYAGLNAGLSSRDCRADVEENRRRIAAWFGVDAAHLLTPYQSHTNIALAVQAPWPAGAAEGDALVTAAENLAVGILTADCGAVLFADPKARIIAAAHAGWKGALNGILQNVIDTMIKLGAKAENILAVSGPSISPQNYEVGAEFRQIFMDKNAAYSRYFTPWTGGRHTLTAPKAEAEKPTYHCDLWRFIHDRLEEKGVQTEDLALCTYADAGRFFSYRRASHKGEPDYGRQISAICLR